MHSGARNPNVSAVQLQCTRQRITSRPLVWSVVCIDVTAMAYDEKAGYLLRVSARLPVAIHLASINPASHEIQAVLFTDRIRLPHPSTVLAVDVPAECVDDSFIFPPVSVVRSVFMVAPNLHFVLPDSPSIALILLYSLALEPRRQNRFFSVSRSSCLVTVSILRTIRPDSTAVPGYISTYPAAVAAARV